MFCVLQMLAEKSVVKWPSLLMGARWPFSLKRRNKWWRCIDEKKKKKRSESKAQMMARTRMLPWPLTQERWEPSGISPSPFLSFFLSVFCDICLCSLAVQDISSKHTKLLHFSWCLKKPKQTKSNPASLQLVTHLFLCVKDSTENLISGDGKKQRSV